MQGIFARDLMSSAAEKCVKASGSPDSFPGFLHGRYLGRRRSVTWRPAKETTGSPLSNEVTFAAKDWEPMRSDEDIPSTTQNFFWLARILQVDALG